MTVYGNNEAEIGQKWGKNCATSGPPEILWTRLLRKMLIIFKTDSAQLEHFLRSQLRLNFWKVNYCRYQEKGSFLNTNTPFNESGK